MRGDDGRAAQASPAARGFTGRMPATWGVWGDRLWDRQAESRISRAFRTLGLPRGYINPLRLARVGTCWAPPQGLGHTMSEWSPSREILGSDRQKPDLGTARRRCRTCEAVARRQSEGESPFPILVSDWLAGFVSMHGGNQLSSQQDAMKTAAGACQHLSSHAWGRSAL